MSVFFDSAISAFICFMVSLATFNYYKIGKPFNLTFAILLAISAFLILFTVLKNLNQKQIKTKKDKNLFLAFCNQLACQTTTQNLNLLHLTTEKAGYIAVKGKNMLKLEKEKVNLFSLFCFDKVSANDLINCYKQTLKNYKTVIVCSPLSNEAQEIAHQLSARIEIVSVDKLFVFLKEHESIPPITVKLEKHKKRLRDLIKQSFTKRRSGHFFYVGLIMLVFSFFVFYPKYYLLMGTFFCAIGLTCLLYGKKT